MRVNDLLSIMQNNERVLIITPTNKLGVTEMRRGDTPGIRKWVEGTEDGNREIDSIRTLWLHNENDVGATTLIIKVRP